MGLVNKSYSRFAFGRKKNDATIQDQHAELLRGIPKSMVINPRQDDEMEIHGYRTSQIRLAVTYLFILLTGGALRLIYHWIPHWFLKSTCVPCPVTEAEKILIVEKYNGKHKIHHVKPLRVLTPECVQKLQKDDDLKQHHITVSDGTPPSLAVHFSDGVFTAVERLLMFSCKKVTYVWDQERTEFVKLKGLDQGVGAEMLHKNRGLSNEEHFMRKLVYGPNMILVKESSIPKLLFLEVLNPFYIFQIMSFILWFCDEYYYYAAAILAMSTFGITMTVLQTRKNQRKLKSTVHSSDSCTVLRPLPKLATGNSGDGNLRTETVSTEALVPGDVLEIPPHGCVMHCDALLLTGNCILNESMLTGESVPVTKTPLPNLPDVFYDPKEHARHTLFCGTRVIQTRYYGNEKVLAVVIRTGFSTAKGALVRSILHPPPVDFRFEKESYRFVALLAAIAGIGFIYTVVTKIMKGVDPRDLVIEALDLITIVIPPALPAAMTVGRYYAQKRLEKNNIYCISPRSINVSGSIDCVCFDKTGTLTEDGLDLLNVVPIKQRTFQSKVENVETLPYDSFLCGLVSCHSLTIIDKEITGDPLDLKMFESTKWNLQDQENVADTLKFNMIYPMVARPPHNTPLHRANPKLEIGIIREFPFSSSSQRMGVIVRQLGADCYQYFCKGSPEMVLNFVKKETIPDDFHDVLESYTQKGYRVIAMAHKELRMSYTKVNKVQREAIEIDLELLGLIVFENRLKPETTKCIQALNEANIRVIMVTGDNVLTALSVARECELVRRGQSVITVNADDSSPPQLYYTLTNTRADLVRNDLSLLSNSASIMSLETVESQTVTTNGIHGKKNPPQTLFNNYRFAMTGKVWGIAKEHHSELIPKLVTRGSVFARMSPEQKQQLVQELQGLGYVVSMCGDGANDCGALKAAHTGISLSEAESSVASPFTSKNPNIDCVLKIIKEGRAALVTSFGIFKYMAAYSLCQFVSVMILYSLESNLTDIEFLYIDLFIISIFAFFFGRTASYPGKLVKETPLSSLISLSPILSLVLQMVLVIGFQVTAFEHLKMQDWYEPSNNTAKDENGCWENYTIFTVSSFQYVILAIVFSKGKPYRASIFSNYGFIIAAVAVTAFSVYLAIYPAEFLVDLFELVLPETYQFRLYLLGYALANFIVSILIEVFLIELLFFKKLRFKFHNVDKSKRKFLAVERDLNRDPKWPVLTSEFKSAASPPSSLPSCTAEIVVEREKKFEKNHVLNGLFEDNGANNSTPTSPKSVSSSVYESFDSHSDNVYDTTADLTGTPVSISSLNMLGRSPKNCPQKKSSNFELNNFEAKQNSPSKNPAVSVCVDDNFLQNR